MQLIQEILSSIVPMKITAEQQAHSIKLSTVTSVTKNLELTVFEIMIMLPARTEEQHTMSVTLISSTQLVASKVTKSLWCQWFSTIFVAMTDIC